MKPSEFYEQYCRLVASAILLLCTMYACVAINLYKIADEGNRRLLESVFPEWFVEDREKERISKFIDHSKTKNYE